MNPVIKQLSDMDIVIRIDRADEDGRPRAAALYREELLLRLEKLWSKT